DLTQAEVIGRRQVAELMAFFREWLPGFEQVVLLESAPQVGIRETRRVVGEHVLSMADLHTGRHFDDVIALGSFPVDLHPETGDGGGTDTGRARGLAAAPIYEIPYRALVPLQVEQLLVAGRCLSAEREALAAVRIMPVCYATGQAAGAGAAVALQDEISPRDVDAGRVQALLRQQGAILDRP
ncbi:MAG: FAD-dependent oxidoreductase, partial [Anaerolineae bacterium]|nr:FAD-dependent oxidoreductase [Anaerolineae bacterium]